MAEPSRFAGGEDEFGGLVLRYLDGLTTPQETDILLAELTASGEQRARTVSLCRQHGQLLELLASQRQQTLLAERAQSASTTVLEKARWPLGLAAALLIAVGLWAIRSWTGKTEGVPLARLEQVQGEVFVVSPVGEKVAVQSGHELASGQGLQTVGEESSATVVYSDSTRLEIGADTILKELIGGRESGKQVFLAEGYLTADVAKQPPGKPMLLSTPQAEVVVLGTKFSLSGGAETTYVETREGKVQVTRKSDGQSIDIGRGFEASISDRKGPLEPQSLPVAAATPRLNLDGYWTASLSPDGTTLAATHYLGGDVERWDVATGRRTTTVPAHRKRVQAVAFSPDGLSLATGGADETVKLWDPAGRLQATLNVPQGWVHDLAFSSDGSQVSVLSGEEGSENRVATVWDVETGQQRFASLRFSAQRWAFSPRGNLLATAGRGEKSITVWDLVTGQTRSVLDGVGKNVFCLAFSHDGETLAIDDSSGMVSLRSVSTGQVRSRLERAGGRIFGMAFSPDDSLLATGNQDGTLRLWDLEAAKQVAVLDRQTGSATHARALAFTPDGKTLLAREIRLATSESRRDGSVQLWDLPIEGE